MNASTLSGNAPDTQVQGEMNLLNAAIERLDETRQELIGRLKPVLRVEPIGLTKAGEEPAMVPLADSIKTCRLQIEVMRNSMVSAIGLLEL